MADPLDELIDRHGCERVVAACRPLLSEQRIDRIEQVLATRLGGVTAVVENLHDPHNGAAAIRSLEALGLQEMHVVESAEPFRFSPAVTIGCEKWVTLHHHQTMPQCATALRDRGVALYATLPGADLAIDDIDVSRPAALVFGNEHEGLTDEAIGVCDDAVSLQMHGFTQSFNLSVSVALSLQRLAERRRAVTGGAGDLGAQERARLRARWYAVGIRGVQEIVDRHVSTETRR